MDTFKGLFRDSVRVKTLPSMWEFARNIILGKGFQSVSNEYGFEVEADIPGVLNGIISANEETVVFSVDGNFSCIGIIKSDNPSVYIPKIRSIYFGFKENRPIEGVFYYNYNKELIVVWCDGVFLDSNPPRLANLTDLDIALTPLLELVNPSQIDLFSLDTENNEGLLDISYGDLITLPLEVVYITWAYLLPDGTSTTGMFPAHHIAYPIYNYKVERQRSIILSFNDLDSNYNKLILGLVVSVEGVLTGYESLPYSYSGTSTVITLTSLIGFKEKAVEALIIPSLYYSRAKTMTFQNNQLVIGNLAVNNTIPFQKYLTQIELGLQIMTDDDSESKFTHPTLCPDEVYAIYIQPQLISGEYIDAFPLIGPEARTSAELDNMGVTELTNMGLYKGTTDGIQPNIYKRFHIENSGDFVLPPPYNPTVPLHNELNWGYWENTEVYPNNNEFDGTIDYQGNPIVGGKDLRNTPIRYFRVPDVYTITEKIPFLLGKCVENKTTVNNTTDPFYGVVPRFGVYVKNFDTVIPQEVRDRLQGFRLLIVKRENGSRVVEDISFAAFAAERTEFYDYLNPIDGAFIPSVHRNGYGLSVLFSPYLYATKAKLEANIVKYNYTIRVSLPIADGETGLPIVNIDNNSTRTLVGNDFFKSRVTTNRYAVFKKIEFKPGNNIVAKTPNHYPIILLECYNYLDNLNGLVWNALNIEYSPTDAELDYMPVKKFNPVTKLYDITFNWDSYFSYAANIENHYTSLSNFTLINLTLNVYTGFKPTEFISLGKIGISNTNKVLYDNGDIFTNVILNPLVGESSPRYTSFTELFIKGSWCPIGNLLVDHLADKAYGYPYDDFGMGLPLGLVGSNFEYVVKNRPSFSSLNDLISALGFDTINKDLSYFPFRVARTQKLANENIQTDVVRTFKANDYYEMPNNRGEVIAVRGTNKQLFIQQKFSLFVAMLKDKLNTGETETYLGEGDLFDRSPEEIRFNTDKGYIGCTNQFAAMIIPDGYVVVDQIKGNIFIIGEGFTEITKTGMTNWFEQNWNTEGYFTLDRFNNRQPVDNPFNSIGHLVGYDEKFNRLLFTKKYYKFLRENEVGTVYSFDGERYYLGLNENRIKLDFADTNYFENKSLTLSFSLSDKVFVCEHDYYPNAYYFNSFGLKSINNDKTLLLDNGYRSYKHNVYNQIKGTYYNGITYDSYVDLIFNSRLDLSKQYQAIEWESVVEGIDNVRKYNKTVDRLVIYTDYQCSGEVTVDQFETARNVEGVWNLNEFRDIVVNQSLPLIDRRGVIQTSNLNNNKSYFEKSVFISTFVVVRLIMSNQTNDDVYVNMVNVKSRISKR